MGGKSEEGVKVWVDGRPAAGKEQLQGTGGRKQLDETAVGANRENNRNCWRKQQGWSS